MSVLLAGWPAQALRAAETAAGREEASETVETQPPEMQAGELQTAENAAGRAEASEAVKTQPAETEAGRQEFPEAPLTEQQAGKSDRGGLLDYWKRKSGSGQEPGKNPVPGVPGREAGEASGDPEDTQSGKKYNTAHQMTEDEIFAMNGGDAAMLYTDGYLTFLRGKYCEEKIRNAEDGILSLNGMASLLGLSKGSEFFAVFTERNADDYVIYTYQQRYGDLTMENAVLKIIVDPEGYTAGLISSFTPNVGIAPEGETSSVTPEEAQDIVSRTYPAETFTFYPEYTRQTSFTIGGIAYHVWAVFTDYPSGDDPPEGMTYLEHLVAYDGSYLMYVAVANPQELVLGDNAQTELALSQFEGLTPDTWTGTVTLHDGTKKEITIPVARDADGTYWLADVERHILLSDHYAFVYEHRYEPWTSPDNTGWPEHYLIVYDSYIKVYDFFASFGLPSVDGSGMPILLLTDYCDGYHNPVNNAGSLGMASGWAVFSASAVNDLGESIDVTAHEFTHGITGYSMTGSLYQNESGALNEALSDVIGNLCEMLMGETEDTEWLLGETGGWIVRNMSFPWEYRQPVTRGGQFYQEPSDTPATENDMGGVHINSGIINRIAWSLCAAGLDEGEAFRLWMEAISLLTPQSGFRELKQALMFAAYMRELDVRWMGEINMLFEQAGL